MKLFYDPGDCWPIFGAMLALDGKGFQLWAGPFRLCGSLPFRVARDLTGELLRCSSCGCTQAIAPVERSGGVTHDEARAIGWKQIEGDEWKCPLYPDCEQSRT